MGPVLEANRINGELKKPIIPPLAAFTGEDITSPDESLTSESIETLITLEDFDKYRVTKEKEIPKTRPMITIGDAVVATKGNITPITAEGKAGKTACKSVLVAGACSNDGNVVDGFHGIHVEPNPEGKAVIDLDTEQSEDDQQYNLKTSLSRVPLNSTPAFYRAYNIRTLAMVDYQRITNDICRLCSERFNGIHSIFIDGAADFISSVNDEAEANSIIAYFTRLAVQYQCPVILIIHLNENAGKNNDTMPRGHIGRQAIRKGYAQLNITKEGDISTLQVLRGRKAGISDTPLISYKYCKDKGYHVSVDAMELATNKQKEKDSAPRRNAEKIAARLFAPPNAYLHKDAVSGLMKATSKSEATAKRLLNDLLGWGIIKKHDDGYYRLIVEGS